MVAGWMNPSSLPTPHLRQRNSCTHCVTAWCHRRDCDFGRSVNLRGAFLAAAFGVLLLQLPVAAETRIKTLFSDAWAFHLGEAAGAEGPGFDDSKWRKLDLPHDWSIEQPYDPNMPGGSSVGYLPGGVGWYRKSFSLPESDRGQEIAIDFDGVSMDSQVWINGHLLGKRPNGYVGFRYDLTPYLKYGSEPNHIAVRANVEPGGSRWYPGAGIYRNVWLVKMNPIHVAHWGTAVTTPEVSKEKASVHLRTEVENKTGADAEVKLTSVVLDPLGKPVATAESTHRITAGAIQEFDQKFVVANPLRWSPDSPDLYRVESTVQAGGKTLDKYTTPLGIRSCEFTADRGFLLNGERVDIKGVCLHHDFGALGTAVSKAALRRQLEILREMGCNAIRTSHNPREPEFYEMCDRMGFLVMNEVFDVWEQKKLANDYHRFFKEWHERDLSDTVRRDRNHPCVILWSIGNEVNEQHKEDFPGQGGEIAKRLVEICKKHDPSRAVTAACNSPQACEKNGITAALDVYGQNYQLGAYPELKGKKPMIGTENATNFATRDSYSFEVVNDRGLKLVPQNTKNSLECTGYGNFWQTDRTESTLRTLRNSPWVAGQFAWTGFDYLGECFPFHWPARNGLFGIMDTAGFPKDTYGIYQADWTDKPMVRIVPKNWNWHQFSGVPIPVKVYTNCDEVELFLNNRSLGVKPVNRAEVLHAEWMVGYEPGALKAIGRKDGQPLCEEIVKTAGSPAKLELLADRTEIAADGEDLSFVEVRLVDKNGVITRDADRKIRVSLSGEGALAGVDNGSATNHAPFKGNEVRTFYGRALVIVKSKRQPGSIVLKISTEGLDDAQTVIATLPPGDAKLTEAAARREREFREENKTYSRHRLSKLKAAATSSPVGLAQPSEEEAKTAATGTITVAPVFKHGSGQHTDSVVASRNKKPPTWTEKDARILIAEEAKRLGVEFTLEGNLPRAEGMPAFDGATKSGKIAFEILTSDDVPDRIDNTDRLTNFLSAAEALAEELKAKPGDFVVGVFYDPLAGKQEIADPEPLRQQVRDFIAWLKIKKHVP